MVSVVQRIKEIPRDFHQVLPKLSEFVLTERTYKHILKENMNIPPHKLGLIVDYLSRFMVTNDKIDAFKVPLIGADYVNELFFAEKYLNQITGLDDKSIIAAVTLISYDNIARGGRFDPLQTPLNQESLFSIRELVNRSLDFYQEYPVILEGFTFGKGYTNIIDRGDGDFITQDTLFDMKVSKYPPSRDHIWQIIIYYFMAKESGIKELENVSKIGIYNPRLNNVYTFDMSDFPDLQTKIIRTKIIGYES